MIIMWLQIGIRANAATRKIDKNDKQVIFKNCAQFTGCINKIKNTQLDNAKDSDIAMII